MGGDFPEPVNDMIEWPSDDSTLETLEFRFNSVGDILPSCDGVAGAIRWMESRLSSILGRSRFLWNLNECSSIMVR